MVKSIKLDDPGISDRDRAAVLAALDSGFLANGPKSRQFERELIKMTGRKHAVAVSSGTTALLASLHALGIGRGSKVLTPAFTFPAPAAAAAFLGAEVVVCDVDPETFCMNAETILPVLDEAVSLVIAIDPFGVPAPVPEIEALLSIRNIPILVDAACSQGSSLNGRPAGSFGDVATFSFHPRKIITTGEGGAVLTDNPSTARRVRHLVNHGMGETGFESIGINLRMSEMGAALGLSQIQRIESIIECRHTHASPYLSLPIEFQRIPAGVSFNHQTLVGVLPEGLGGAHRDELLARLRHHHIEAGIAGYCLSAVPAVANHLGIESAAVPHARVLHERGVALPLHTKMEKGDSAGVARLIADWLREKGCCKE